MSKWSFAFDNAPLRQELREKLERFDVLRDIPDTKSLGGTTCQDVRFIKDFFTPDGYPHLPQGAKLEDTTFPYLFPAIAPWYTGAAFPAAVMEMDALFRQTACQSAMKWLHSLADAANSLWTQEQASETFHGLAFQEVYNGVSYTVAFPDTRLNTTSHGLAAVVLVADSYWNNEAWEKSSSVPLYAHQMAQFQMWCWERFAEECGYQVEAPTTAFIVRICGNLPVDCAIRTVDYNPIEARAMVNRILKAKAQEAQKGLYWKRFIDKPRTWTEKLEEDAFRTDDPDLHELVVAYMKARSNKKAVERNLNEVTAKMDGIAVKLAGIIPAGNLQGKYTLPDGTICTVTHQARRSRGRSISPELVRSLFPECQECITTSSSTRKYVTIEAL